MAPPQRGWGAKIQTNRDFISIYVYERCKFWRNENAPKVDVKHTQNGVRKIQYISFVQKARFIHIKVDSSIKSITFFGHGF